MNALEGAHDAAAQMIDTSIVRVHTTPIWPAWPANYGTIHIAKKTGKSAEGLDAPWIETTAPCKEWPHAASEDDKFRKAESPFHSFQKCSQ